MKAIATPTLAIVTFNSAKISLMRWPMNTAVSPRYVSPIAKSPTSRASVCTCWDCWAPSAPVNASPMTVNPAASTGDCAIAIESPSWRFLKTLMAHVIWSATVRWTPPSSATFARAASIAAS
ncbi:MAG: hypothetical protein BWZ09_02768 [Alphaproteobacteria bacterium ADurb.BinA305]|nr:MAG: hypothetical protein BWZ09_02768 [Alphaproteobacteria bacterium ADurb.BinA305]